MTPEQQQALNTHVQAIAKIFYDDSDPKAIQTLEGVMLISGVWREKKEGRILLDETT